MPEVFGVLLIDLMIDQQREQRRLLHCCLLAFVDYITAQLPKMELKSSWSSFCMPEGLFMFRDSNNELINQGPDTGKIAVLYIAKVWTTPEGSVSC